MVHFGVLECALIVLAVVVVVVITRIFDNWKPLLCKGRWEGGGGKGGWRGKGRVLSFQYFPKKGGGGVRFFP